MHLGDNIKRIRNERGISQGELSERSGLSSGQISKIEVGIQKNPHLETVVTLSTSLGVSIEELVFGTEGPNGMKYMLNAIDTLPTEKQAIIKELISAFVAQSTAEKIRSQK
jgi:transcriptional regulator with XRE-family HTH domain